MPETSALPDFDAMPIAALADWIAANPPPPVERWHPSHCGDSEMRIARDGQWFHQGSPIGRAALVRQFARILRREKDGSHVLVTPAEKLSIEVEDAPFIAVAMKSEGKGDGRRIAFRLNSGEPVIAGPGHAIALTPKGQGGGGDPHPCLHVRGGLQALIARPVYYELAEIALNEAADPPGLWSDGAFFAFAA